MSGYLARLVDRAAGPPAAALSPRVGPVFPVRPPGRGNAPALAEVGGDEGRAPRSTGPILAGRDAAPAPRADLPAPSRGRPRRDAEAEVGRRTPASAPGRITRPIAPVAEPAGPSRPRGEALEAPEPQSPRPNGPAGAPEPVGPRAPAPSLDEPLAGRRAQAETPSGPDAARVEARVEPVIPSPPPGEPPTATPAARAEPVAVEPVVAQPRAAASALPQPQAVAHSAREQAPRIEVRIGRVEVRRPSPPEPVEWPAPAPAAVEQAASGFAELAAARRYVDRRWS